MQKEIDFAVGYIILLGAFVLFGLTCFLVAGALHLYLWLRDRVRWVRWFSL